jgi:hypothetical protein
VVGLVTQMHRGLIVSIDGNKSLYFVFVGVVFLSILDCF